MLCERLARPANHTRSRTSIPHAERRFAQRMGATTIEVDSGHAAMVSRPDDRRPHKTAAEAVAAE
jgi:hypothetical protein